MKALENMEIISLDILWEQIQAARNRMIQLWDERGYTDNEVLSASIVLDELLNKYQRLRGLAEE